MKIFCDYQGRHYTICISDILSLEKQKAVVGVIIQILLENGAIGICIEKS